MKTINSSKVTTLTALLACLVAPATYAKSFQMLDGKLQGYFDTTIGYDLITRTERPNNAGSYSNRIWDQGDVVSNKLKGSHDLQLKYGNSGALIRGNYFYDFEMADTRLNPAAKHRAVRHGDITDAYVYTQFGADQQFNFRLGKQVISWGESTFISGSINDTNTVDITKLRTAGAELKDAFIGTPAAYFQWLINESWTFETYILAAFDEVKIDPSGSFFATADFLVDGGGFIPAPDGGPTGLGPFTRLNDDLNSGGGQYGIALRYFAPLLFNGVEFGFFYQNLHDHNPYLSTYAGSFNYFLDYPEDIKRYGVSFNTLVGSWAVGGEYSFRPDSPIQGTEFQAVGAGATALAPGTKFEGWGEVDRHQVQVTTQRIFGRMWGGDQLSFISEVAYGWIGDLPTTGFTPLTPPSDSFWGYQFSLSLTFNEALFNMVNLTPKVALGHDVNGQSTENPAVFIEDEKSLTVGLDFNFLVNWKGGFAYTVKSKSDRDFAGFNISYAF
ncbi:MAG: DUF1302 domain-containing protein [Gammaproteobacteria bacterium]|nr:DUF1302 domain-containing protein [Gammaproteobacteria bacterium]